MIRESVICIVVTGMILGFVMPGNINGQQRSTATQRHPAEPEMVFVEGGTFTMGCTAEQDGNCFSNEKPAHQVTVDGFYIGKYEVTQAQWKAIMGATVRQQRDKVGKNGVHGEGDNHPIYYVSWDEAQEFISRLNEATGKQYRLPTEAEWEYAARGGAKSKNCKYSGSNNIDEVAWHDGNSARKTHPVGTKSPNELGLYDMSGNVWEWCNDWYSEYDSNPQTNPTGPATGSYHVIHGGCWYYFGWYSRVSYRSYRTPGFSYYDLGFRLASSSR